MRRNPHPTKSGPGRRHRDGQPHGKAPKQAKGAPAGFVQRRVNPKREERRAAIACMGKRQFLRALKAGRAINRDDSDHRYFSRNFIVFPELVE